MDRWDSDKSLQIQSAKLNEIDFKNNQTIEPLNHQTINPSTNKPFILQSSINPETLDILLTFLLI
jgi:hypothetical protein